MSKRKRLAYLVTAPDIDLNKPGGPRAHIRGTIQGIEAHGWEVKTFFVGDTLNKSEPETKKRLLKAMPPASRSKLRLILSDFKRFIKNWNLDKKIVQALDDYQPDVIYERSWGFSFGGVRFAKERRVPLFIETSGCEAEITAEAYGISSIRLCNYLDSIKFNKARAVVTQSVNSLESTKDKFHVKVPLIPKPIGFELGDCSSDAVLYKFPEVFKEFKKNHRALVGFVGTFGIYQGPHFLMEVIENMNEMNPEIGFLLIGGGGKQKECLQLAEKNNLKNVYFTGMVNPKEVSSWLNNCQMAFVPDCDPFMSPIKVLEYGACGMPVIVPDYVAFNGLIIDGETGRRFQPGNIHSASSFIADLAHDKEGLSRMSEKIQSLIQSDFSHAKVVKDLVLEMERCV